MEIQHFTRPVAVTLLVGPVLWYLIFWIYYTYPLGSLTSPYLGAYVRVMNSPLHWFGSIFTVGFCLMPMFLLQYVKARFWPIPNQVGPWRTHRARDGRCRLRWRARSSACSCQQSRRRASLISRWTTRGVLGLLLPSGQPHPAATTSRSRPMSAATCSRRIPSSRMPCPSASARSSRRSTCNARAT